MLEKMTLSGSADSFTWYALALEYRSAQRWQDALHTFAQLREQDPAYVPMYLMAGQIFLENKQPAAAAEWLREGITKAQAKNDTHAQGELEALLEEVVAVE